MQPRDRNIWMWEQAFDLLDRADRLHRHFFRLGAEREKGPCWEPPIDVVETDRKVMIVVALPGVAPDQLEIVVGDATLSIVGERPVHLPANTVIRRLEIPYGRFERRINLPQGRFEIEERALEHGCLRVVLRKI
ncbi:MAG TPA: Hsp20/alpha crystallin family protein [Casimicrobiaceae bacterium]